MNFINDFISGLDVGTLINNLGTGLLLSALPGLLLFVLYYGILSDWRATRVGRAIFWLALSLLVVCAMFGMSLLVGDWPGRWVIRCAAYAFVSGTVWRLFFELRRIQKGPHV